jgi:DinB superfamily
MIDKANLMKEFDQARSHMRQLLDEIDARVKIYPEWTIKELLAHLAGWDDATILSLQAFEKGEATPLLAMRGIDFYNAQTVGERTELDLSQIIREWEMVREQLLAILAAMPEEKLSEKIVSPWGPTFTVARLVQIMADHEEEHAMAIQELIDIEISEN